jgi:hypothetical protein
MSVLSYDEYSLNLDNMKTPYFKGVIDKILSDFNKKQDDLLKEALNKHLPGWAIGDLIGRVRCDSFYGAGKTVYFLDEKAILQINRVESNVVSKNEIHTFSSEFKYQIL